MLLVIFWFILPLVSFIFIFKGGLSTAAFGALLFLKVREKIPLDPPLRRPVDPFLRNKPIEEPTDNALVFWDNFMGLFFVSHNFFRSMSNIAMNRLHESIFNFTVGEKYKKKYKSTNPNITFQEICEELLEVKNNYTNQITAFKATSDVKQKEQIRSDVEDNLKDIAYCRTNAREYFKHFH